MDIIGFVVGIVLWSLLIGVIAVAIADSIVLVPAYHYGVLERFRQRTGKIYDEGIGLKLPFVDKVFPISMGLTAIDVEVSFTASDKLQLTLKGSLQYRPNPAVTDENGRNLFISMSETIIKSGIEDMLSDVLGGLGGHYNADHFIGGRQALGDIINEILRFKTPYHLRHTGCTLADCKYAGKEQISAEKLIGFYNDHWEKIKEERRTKEEERRQRAAREKQQQEEEKDQSSVERRYGIGVEVFALATVDFSPEMKKAFEKEKDAEARQKAFRRKLRMAGVTRRILKVDGQVALNAADVSLTPEIAANKTVISVEGEAGVLGGLVNAFATGRQSGDRKRS